MIVDDDDDIRITLGEVLEHRDYEVALAEHGRAALDLLRSGVRPDVILLDLMMPVMDGFELLVELRKQPALAKIPIIVITAAGDAEVEAGKVAAAGHLQKPFKVEDLLETIRRAAHV